MALLIIRINIIPIITIINLVIVKLNLSRPGCCFLSCGKGSWPGADVDGDADADDDANANADVDAELVLVLDSFCPGFEALWLSLPVGLLKLSAQASTSPKLSKTLSGTFTRPSLTSESN